MAQLVSVGSKSSGFVAWLGRVVNAAPPFAKSARLLFRMARILTEHGEKFCESIETFCTDEAKRTAPAKSDPDPTDTE